MVDHVDEVTVESITEFLGIISDLRDETKEKGQTLFFRGQEKSSWDVMPGVFREGMLSFEEEIIQNAYARNPQEFAPHLSSFEKLTKLQHYNLCTRLLDVTLNPLVALYFACKKSISSDETNNNGIVLCHTDYPKNYDNIEVRILSAVAEMEINGKTLNQLLDELKYRNIISDDEDNRLKENDYAKIINILQSNYFVTSNFSNERLIRQNGAFLIPGCINIDISRKGGERKLHKAKYDLKSEFKTKYILIPEENKEQILDELCLYNVHEGALFPEFEHQMNYIKSRYLQKDKKEIATFKPFNYVDEKLALHHTPADNKEEPGVSYKLTLKKKLIYNAVNAWGPDKVSKDELYKIFDKNYKEQWYDDEELCDKIRKELCEYIQKAKPHLSSEAVSRLANLTLNMTIRDVREELGHNKY